MNRKDAAKSTSLPRPYYRRDQDDGVTAPDLSKSCSYAEHIVHARGKRSQFTSVSLDPAKIARFGPRLYELLREVLAAGGHGLIEHDAVLRALRDAAVAGEKAERDLALRAVRYATRSTEGLVEWSFEIASVERKDLITWAWQQIQKYFKRL